MTAKQCWEGLLTELSKVNAPSLLLSEFNYFFNKAINQYINKRYNIYDVNQQLTDDLRVLKATSVLKPKKVFNENSTDAYSSITGDLKSEDLVKLLGGQSNLFGATYEVNLPLDYLHVLNCVCIYKMKSRFKCYDKDDVVQFGAKRLTADVWSVIINDYYNRPLPERPYYYIHNVNQSSDLPTNPVSVPEIGNFELNRENFTGTDVKFSIEGKEDHGTIVTSLKKDSLPNSIDIGLIQNISTVEKEAGMRYGNPTNVRMEIRYGSDDSVFELQAVLIDYIKSPQVIRLTQKQVNLTQDESQIMEFPDYVCQEIINELVHLVMETSGDPRLQTHAVVTESIASPVQQQTKTKA